MPSQLTNFIKQLINLNGPISIEAYWNICLSHPEHGYYMKQDPFGSKGDFITAPEISQLFGEMIGIWAIEQWDALGRPAAFYLVECGAGRGTLMADILRTGKVIPEFLEATQIHLIETSPTLREKQGEALKGFQVVWHENLKTLPDHAPIIIIGNEFLDALPIQQFMFQDGQWFERMIGVNNNEDMIFGLSPVPCAESISLSLRKDGLEERVISEISPAREYFILDISKRIKHQGGAGLMIDYGHDVSAFGDTFQAIQNHQYVDVLKECGDADLTSHVDFGSLKKIGEIENLSVNMTSQGNFLKRLGIESRAAQLMQKSTAIESGYHRLIDNDKMGQLFKVMEIT